MKIVRFPLLKFRVVVVSYMGDLFAVKYSLLRSMCTTPSPPGSDRRSGAARDPRRHLSNTQVLLYITNIRLN